ncbi:MAG: class I SAM-dependent methyltransferase [Acidobacteria bacterium]|nr:class I SAM-dependent methyltransferase [Acidobacteriota bacterium]
MRAVCLTVMMACLWVALDAVPQQPRAAHGRLFQPEKLGELEGPDRDEWQQPEQIMDKLLIADGSRVGDIGAGGGWFTVRLARRVGPNGRVFAEDIQRQMIESIQRRVAREGLSNVEPILGSPLDPRLPPGLDAVLMVDTYPQLDDPVGLMTHVRRSLKPNGRLGIVDFKKDVLGPGPALDERLEPEVIIRDAARAGLKLQAHETFLRYQYLLVFTPR